MQHEHSSWPSIANRSLSVLHSALAMNAAQNNHFRSSPVEPLPCLDQDGPSGESTFGPGTPTWPTDSDASSPTHVQSINSHASPHDEPASALAVVIPRPAGMGAPESLHLHEIPETSSGYPSLFTGQLSVPGMNDNIIAHFPPGHQLTPYHLHPSSFPKSNAVSPLSPGSIQHGYFLHHGGQAAIVHHLPPDRTTLSRRRSHRARKVNVEGTAIDMDDLHVGAGQADGSISVHQCRWAISSNPCGMWIIGSRSHVGAHIRKWHNERQAAQTAQCLWDGCATRKTILKDSLNRHIVTVHLGEGFRCRGCNQTYSRKDVYDSHVKNGDAELCKDAGVVVVYNTSRRMIDARRALQ